MHFATQLGLQLRWTVNVRSARPRFLAHGHVHRSHFTQILGTAVLAVRLICEAYFGGNVLFHLHGYSRRSIHVVVNAPIQFHCVSGVKDLKVVRHQSLECGASPKSTCHASPSTVGIKVTFLNNRSNILVYCRIGSNDGKPSLRGFDGGFWVDVVVVGRVQQP